MSELPDAPALRHNAADGRWYIILEWASATQAREKVDVTELMGKLRAAAIPKDYEILKGMARVTHEASCHNWNPLKMIAVSAALDEWIKQNGTEPNLNAGAASAEVTGSSGHGEGGAGEADYGPFA